MRCHRDRAQTSKRGSADRIQYIPLWMLLIGGSPVLLGDVCGADAALWNAVKQKAPCVLPKTAANILHVIRSQFVRKLCHPLTALCRGSALALHSLWTFCPDCETTSKVDRRCHQNVLALVCKQICLCLRVEGVHIDAWLQEHKFLDASVDPQLRKHNIV